MVLEELEPLCCKLSAQLEDGKEEKMALLQKVILLISWRVTEILGQFTAAEFTRIDQEVDRDCFGVVDVSSLCGRGKRGTWKAAGPC